MDLGFPHDFCKISAFRDLQLTLRGGGDRYLHLAYVTALPLADEKD